MRALGEELTRNGVESEFFVYDGADHAFFNDTRPEVYNDEHAKTAWRRTVDFFKRHL